MSPRDCTEPEFDASSNRPEITYCPREWSIFLIALRLGLDTAHRSESKVLAERCQVAVVGSSNAEHDGKCMHKTQSGEGIYGRCRAEKA